MTIVKIPITQMATISRALAEAQKYSTERMLTSLDIARAVMQADDALAPFRFTQRLQRGARVIVEPHAKPSDTLKSYTRATLEKRAAGWVVVEIGRARGKGASGSRLILTRAQRVAIPDISLQG